MKIISPLSFKSSMYAGEINSQASLTVPDDSLTIGEILRRYAKGLPLGGAVRIEYDDIEDDDQFTFLPDPRTLDLADRERMSREVTEEIKTIKVKRKKADPPPADPVPGSTL